MWTRLILVGFLVMGCNGEKQDPGDCCLHDDAYDDAYEDEDQGGDDAWGGDEAEGEDDAGAGDDGGGDDGLNPDADADADACRYTSIYSSAGMFFEVQEGASRHLVTPADSAQGFRCIRVEFDVDAPDNIDDIANMGLGCPIFLHIGAVSISDGQRYRALAAGWFRFRAVGCTQRTGGELEVAVNANSTGFRGQVGPGRNYHVVIEVERLATARLSFFSQGGQVGPTLELPITGISRERTNDFQLVFGIDGIGDGAYFPYFGARYSDLEILADQGL